MEEDVVDQVPIGSKMPGLHAFERTDYLQREDIYSLIVFAFQKYFKKYLKFFIFFFASN